MNFPDDVKTREEKEQYLLECLEFLATHVYILGSSKTQDNRAKAVELCKAILKRVLGQPEMTKAAILKAKFIRDWKITNFIGKVSAKDKTIGLVPDGFKVFRIPGRIQEFMSSADMRMFLGNTPHDPTVLGHSFQNFPLSLFSRGFVSTKGDMLLYSCIPILEGDVYSAKAIIFSQSIKAWRTLFGTFNVTFVLTTSNVIDHVSFNDLRSQLKLSGVNVFKVNDSLSLEENTIRFRHFLRKLDI